MINLLIEILLLLPFGMLIIKAVQALTDEGGLLRFLVKKIESNIDLLMYVNDKYLSNMEELKAKCLEEPENDSIMEEMKKHVDDNKGVKHELNKLLFFTKPLYRCPYCMSSIWGTLTWLWWVQFSPLPIGTWPIYCLVLCGAMYMYENRYSPEIFIKNEVKTNEIEE